MVLAIRTDALAQNMTVAVALPKLPQCQPSDDASSLQVLDDLQMLSPPVLSTWDRLTLIWLYSVHQDMKQDLMKKRIRDVCAIRVREYC